MIESKEAFGWPRNRNLKVLKAWLEDRQSLEGNLKSFGDLRMLQGD